MTGRRDPSNFLIKKKEDVMGDCPSTMHPDWRFSSRNSQHDCILSGVRGYILVVMEAGAPSINLISWSHIRLGGNWSKFSCVKTSENSAYSSGTPGGSTGCVRALRRDSWSITERVRLFQLIGGLKCCNQSNPKYRSAS